MTFKWWQFLFIFFFDKWINSTTTPKKKKKGRIKKKKIEPFTYACILKKIYVDSYSIIARMVKKVISQLKTKTVYKTVRVIFIELQQCWQCFPGSCLVFVTMSWEHWSIFLDHLNSIIFSLFVIILFWEINRNPDNRLCLGPNGIK